MSRAASKRIEELYGQHAPLVLGVCRSLLRDATEAEDAAQQTFLSAQRALGNGSVPRDPVPWLATIARNECFARVRARAAGPVPTADEPELTAPDIHVTAIRREEVAELREALAELPAQQREAILLREVRGLSYDEVAASLAVTTSAVESLIFRARRRLQLRLREAVTAVSPVGWLMPVRELALRLGSSGLTQPDVAKVVAVGVGAAALAGGVTVTPQLLRSEHSAPRAHAARVGPRTVPGASAAPMHAIRPLVAVVPAAWTAAAEHTSRPAEREQRQAAADARDSAAQADSSGGEQETETLAAASAPQPTSGGDAPSATSGDGAGGDGGSAAPAEQDAGGDGSSGD